MLADLYLDLRYALRSFARHRGFTLVAVATLALGIGANTAIFSVVNAVLWRPLPYKDSDRIVRLVANVPAEDSPTRAPARPAVTVSIAELREIRSLVKSVTHAGLVGGGTIMALSGVEDGARLQGYRVSAAGFDMVDAHPIIGRVFEESDEVPGGDSVVVLSHAMWQRHFAGDPQILGRTLTFNTVLGQRRQNHYT